jgi:hypothetical protein
MACFFLASKNYHLIKLTFPRYIYINLISAIMVINLLLFVENDEKRIKPTKLHITIIYLFSLNKMMQGKNKYN